MHYALKAKKNPKLTKKKNKKFANKKNAIKNKNAKKKQNVC